MQGHAHPILLILQRILCRQPATLVVSQPGLINGRGKLVSASDKEELGLYFRHPSPRGKYL